MCLQHQHGGESEQGGAAGGEVVTGSALLRGRGGLGGWGSGGLDGRAGGGLAVGGSSGGGAVVAARGMARRGAGWQSSAVGSSSGGGGRGGDGGNVSARELLEVGAGNAGLVGEVHDDGLVTEVRRVRL